MQGTPIVRGTMFDHEEFDNVYQSAVDSLDVNYRDGIAYMSIHTVDVINGTLLDVIEIAANAVDPVTGQPLMSAEMERGAIWVMTIWKQLHDELDLRAEVDQMPDTPEALIDDDKE